jgi:hypothetical protein
MLPHLLRQENRTTKISTVNSSLVLEISLGIGAPLQFEQGRACLLNVKGLTQDAFCRPLDLNGQTCAHAGFDDRAAGLEPRRP